MSIHYDEFVMNWWGMIPVTAVGLMSFLSGSFQFPSVEALL